MGGEVVRVAVAVRAAVELRVDVNVAVGVRVRVTLGGGVSVGGRVCVRLGGGESVAVGSREWVAVGNGPVPMRMAICLVKPGLPCVSKARAVTTVLPSGNASNADTWRQN